MCLFVIMCALALIRTGAAAMSDNDVDSGDNREACLQECVSRCEVAERTRWRDCVSSCETACDTPRSASVQERDATSPCADKACDPSDAAGRRPSRRRLSRSPMMREAAIIARSVGMDLGPLDAGAVGDETEVETKVSPRLDSLLLGEDSVTAVVSWTSPQPRELPPWYLVTWEPEGGGVRGNLLVNSTSASLSLYPGAIYHIQVSSPGAASHSCLEVDTRSAPRWSPRGARGPRVEDIAGVAAAVVLFLAVLLSALRWRTRLQPNKNVQDCDRFKQYPPPVTLLHLAEDGRTNQQPAV